MSSISSAAVAAALPLFHLGHRRGSPVQASASTDALTHADSTSNTSAPATNQSIFSSLLQTAEQVAGVNLTAPTAPAAAASTATPAVAATQSSAGGSNDRAAQIARLQLLLSNSGQAGTAQSVAGARINTVA